MQIPALLFPFLLNHSAHLLCKLSATQVMTSALSPFSACLERDLDKYNLDLLANFLKQSMDLDFLMQCRQTNVTMQPLVLAVDDDEDSLLLLTEILKPMRCSFITATHGEAALLIAQDHQPMLILLDVMLPDLNGAEVLQRLKQNPQTRKIPVVAVTALASTEDRKSLLVGGCDDYISKPYMLEELEAIIYRYLNQMSFVA